ncbi:MAG: DMT family transporter, partial [Burkholderiales bacterium]
HKVVLTTDGKALTAILIALFGISVGTLYQKRYCSHVDLRSGAFIQFFGCAIAYAPIVLGFERAAPIQWTPGFVFALGWLVVVLSVGAISLLYWLLRHGAASNVAGLFFLVPAATAVMAWFLFDETLDAVAVAGMVLISVGVALARQIRDPVAP